MKRARALKKTKAEQELGRQKDREIDRLEEEIGELSEVVTKQKADLKRYKIYQKFMERVLEKSDEVRRRQELNTRTYLYTLLLVFSPYLLV